MTKKTTKYKWAQARKLRTKGLFQKDIATIMGVSQMTICNWLREPEPEYSYVLGLPERNLLRAIKERCVPGPGECLDWALGKSPEGYGRIWVHDTGLMVHRAVGLVSAGLDLMTTDSSVFVLHSCDRPSCCNPDHLRIGTAKENSQDMIRRGRTYDRRGTGNPKAILTEDQVMDIRRREATGTSRRSLEEEFGVSKSTIGYLVTGRSWSHLPVLYKGNCKTRVMV